MVVPIYKKGDQERTENYSGVSLLCTGYKIFTEILRERLEEEIVRKGLLPESQGGFRRDRGTVDNIFILNHIIQREKCKGERVYAMFVDLKAAFDNVDRNKLWWIMQEGGERNKRDINKKNKEPVRKNGNGNKNKRRDNK